MNRCLYVPVFVSALIVNVALGQSAEPTPAFRNITLQEAVQLALHHHHSLRIAELQVQEKQHAKDVARSSYFPSLRNDSNVIRVTDSQFIAIPAGGLGGSTANPIPPESIILNQGGRTLISSGTQLTQPLTEFLKFRHANEIASAEVNASREKQQQTTNDVALEVHQLYYSILISETYRSAAQARIQAAEDLQKERVQQVKYGSLLEEDLIESKAQYLQAKQDLLRTDLRLSDLMMQLNDAMGLPLNTQLMLESSIPELPAACVLQECVRAALQGHPEILEAQQEVKKASAGVRLARADYVPDVSVFARYSYDNNVPFLARNFGTFGVHVGYDLFDGGKKRSTLREREAQLAQAQENLDRLKDEVVLKIRTAYNKLQRTQQMVRVSEELLALNSELRRVTAQQFVRGVVLKSQADSAAAQEYDAKASLLQSQLDYMQAQNEMTHAIGRTPN